MACNPCKVWPVRAKETLPHESSHLQLRELLNDFAGWLAVAPECATRHLLVLTEERRAIKTIMLLNRVADMPFCRLDCNARGGLWQEPGDLR